LPQILLQMFLVNAAGNIVSSDGLNLEMVDEWWKMSFPTVLHDGLYGSYVTAVHNWNYKERLQRHHST